MTQVSFADTTDKVLQNLMSQYGPLMTTDEVAAVLRRKPRAIRVAMCDSYSRKVKDSAWADRLRAARVPMGWRVYYSTLAVAELATQGAKTEAVEQE